jgi:uncharacterized membrane protein
MPDVVNQVLLEVIRWLEVIGGSVLILGFIVTTFRWLVDISRRGAVEAAESYRKSLGRAVIIGLEILVAATIIKTITLEPTIDGMSFLAIMVAIRTALGWAMALELNGRWPWQCATNHKK